ncbi:MULTISPECIES: hypothetical protein [unclassified Pseudomonas]|uniref:hypothetical protein n=1 Tax=unclassified Pseudomonas TaxID=196821 RepID=UPI00119AC382|nr:MULTISPECIES: hypothetical protein [unclassified Pseudomonas]TWC06586.1 hypothetical protein FBY00_1558 [Pseudomonas sp. SJZ075]TWC11190.1 hypothetical protein FBX99_14912 [Pseudomonas sp. SJZ074]TWC25944.1 hypothetical protein FBY02_15312 [Pseudomonas sp. SJZ078]TWC29644.1 hypothetical protein FBY06_1498 [Pseudomonas sp. SJZ085]TWC45075.1 hypothetical protein FBY11_1559 [Pseudomonas sp. SJZ124]
MSVLNFPRIYLNGHMFWNPPTANNNDVFPLYDAVNMDINWPFMSHFDITPTNAPTLLMPWTTTPLQMNDLPDYVLQVPGNGRAGNYPYMPAEWDLFGDNACGTVDYNTIHSTIIGGELQANSYIAQDALIGKNYQLLGNPFGNAGPTAARFVDISPWQNTFTALYFDKLVLGDATCGLTLNRQYRMMDRFLNFEWAGDLHGLVYVSVTWQTCFSQDNVQWAIGDSNLLKNLQQQMTQQGAQGLMFRFSTYLTCYDMNGVFNDFPYINSRSHDLDVMKQMQLMYDKGLNNVADIFFNPAYSRTAATLGLWFADEYPTAPGGLRLIPDHVVSVSQPGQAKQSIKLGVTSVQITDNILSLDLANTFPSYPVNPNVANLDIAAVDTSIPIAVPEKFQAGNYQLGVNQNGFFTPVVSFGYEHYQQSAFNLRSGLLDFTLSDADKALLQTGSLELHQQDSAQPNAVRAALQQEWTAEVIESGSFINVGDHATLSIMVQQNGQPAANTTLWVAEYDNPYMVTSSDYYLAFSNDADFTLFYDHPDHRELNAPNLPQFTGAPPIPNYRSTGAGRRLTNLEKVDDSIGKAISYQQFLRGEGKPIAVDLRPCLAFDAGIYVTGTLANDQSTQINYSYVMTTTNDKGIAQVSFKGVAPGFPTLRFIVKDSDKDPTIPFSFPIIQAHIDFLAPLRVLPLDFKLQQDFVNTWNDIYLKPTAAKELWDGFIYPRILQSFYYLYPIMNKYMPLDSQARVEGAIDQFIVLIKKEYQDESTLAMPITRDMSQSRRSVLELWAKRLVKHNYPPQQLHMSDYDDL